MKAQLASPGFTPIFAAVMAVVNTKIPENGELLLKRLEKRHYFYYMNEIEIIWVLVVYLR